MGLKNYVTVLAARKRKDKPLVFNKPRRTLMNYPTMPYTCPRPLEWKRNLIMKQLWVPISKKRCGDASGRHHAPPPLSPPPTPLLQALVIRLQFRLRVDAGIPRSAVHAPRPQTVRNFFVMACDGHRSCAHCPSRRRDTEVEAGKLMQVGGLVWMLEALVQHPSTINQESHAAPCQRASQTLNPTGPKQKGGILDDHHLGIKLRLKLDAGIPDVIGI